MDSTIETPKLPLWKRILQVLWDSDLYTKSKEERALVFKLDVAILSSICFSWWMKYIDQANLSNAYVSGMKEDLNIQANEYTYMGTSYNVAITVMTLLSNLIVLKVRPSIWLPLCEIGWGIFTFAQAGAQNSTQMYAFRAILGLFEASFQPVCIFLLGSWYTKKELAKRMSIWFITGPAGLAFSGFLQAGIYKGMDGVHGIAGWRWLYIICGCMTVPTGFLLFFTLPDFPSNCNSWFISDAERELAQARCARNGMAPVTGKVSLKLFKDVLTGWRFWVIVPAYVLYANAVQDGNYFAIWLKSAGFSVSDRNVLSSCMWLISIPFSLFYGYMSDRTGNRWVWLVGPMAVSLIPSGILMVWPEGVLIKECAFLFCQTVLITHIFYTYMNEICKDNAEERALIASTMAGLFYCTNAWLPILIFPQTEGPSFRKGFPSTFAFGLASIPGFCLMRYMHGRQLRQQANAKLPLDEESNSSSSDVKDMKSLAEGVTIPVL